MTVEQGFLLFLFILGGTGIACAISWLIDVIDEAANNDLPGD